MTRFRSQLSLAAAALALAFAGSAAALEVSSETVPGSYDANLAALEQSQLAGWLKTEENTSLANQPVKVVLTAEEQQRMNSAPEDQGRLLVGITRGVTHSIVAEKASFGEWRQGRDVNVWNGVVQAPGATGLRLHFPGFSLPAGAELYVYSSRGEAFGPYVGKGPNDAADLWTNTIVGDEIRVQLRTDAAARGKLELQLADVVVLGDKFLYGAAQTQNSAFCSFNASCITNASCNTLPAPIASARNGVAHLQFVVSGNTYICSGGLLNDTVAATTIPYFITANHCFSTQAQTNTLEAYFKFNASCGGACYNPEGAVPRMLGGTLLRTNSQSDYTFLRLAGTLPTGSTLLGWNSAAVANTAGTQLYRLSHPKGAPQAYSRHSVNTTAGTCGGWPRGRWIYSNDTLGATEGGSSGSPVMNASGQVVGQLSGACGATPATSCDGDDRTVDGALANYFANVRTWLAP
jgi:lysyl endopeptidase